MTRKSPNPFQKLVRSAIRDLINQANSHNTEKPAKPKTKKSAATKSPSKPKPDKKKRSRHIPASVRYTVLHRDSHKWGACQVCRREAGEG